MELRAAIAGQPTDPEEVGFTSAAQIVCLNRRVLRDGRMSNEAVHIISSLKPREASPDDLKKIKRDYWSIESDLHYRLDEVLDEDRSRVRTPKAAFVLGMLRRLTVSFAISWIAQRKKTRQRTSTRDFHDHLRAENAHRAFGLVTSKSPTAWKI